MTKDKFNTGKLITAADCDDIFSGFKNDKERLKYMKNSPYSKMSLAKSFSIFYGIEVDPAVKSDKSVNNVNVIKIGNVYSGTVKEFTKNSLTFDTCIASVGVIPNTKNIGLENTSVNVTERVPIPLAQ